MVLGLSNGRTNPHTSVNFIAIIFMEKEYTLGQTAESMKVNGKLIKCTVKELSLGLMDGNI